MRSVCAFSGEGGDLSRGIAGQDGIHNDPIHSLRQAAQYVSSGGNPNQLFLQEYTSSFSPIQWLSCSAAASRGQRCIVS